MNSSFYYILNDLPIGSLKLVKNGYGSLTQISFLYAENKTNQEDNSLIYDSDLFKEEEKQLKEYFNGRRKIFKIKFDVSSGTAFQQKVWNELLNIPYGETISYEELANRINNAKASRAVGNANGMNPLPILIPCHRVIKKDGSLGGYSSGIELKKKLLVLENNKTI